MWTKDLLSPPSLSLPMLLQWRRSNCLCWITRKRSLVSLRSLPISRLWQERCCKGTATFMRRGVRRRQGGGRAEDGAAAEFPDATMRPQQQKSRRHRRGWVIVRTGWRPRLGSPNGGSMPCPLTPIAGPTSSKLASGTGIDDIPLFSSVQLVSRSLINLFVS